MFKAIWVFTALLASGLAVAELTEKIQKKLDAADAAFKQAVAKAENAKFYAVQKATADRVKILKQSMIEATKTGDLEAANEIKSRITAAELAGGIRAKPKNVVKFGGHEYALIADKATWHVAKRLCEEMGGHLVVINSTDENSHLLSLCKASKSEPWIGATDELIEGKWQWVDRTRFELEIHQDNANGIQHYLLYHAGLGTWDDGDGGARYPFVCEWEQA